MDSPLSQNIPLAKIHPNPNQPRHVITPEMVDSKAASIQAVGLLNPIKVSPLPDGTYQVISGHIRFAAVTKLGWETIPAQVLNLTPEKALLEAILDNRGQPMNWLETYIAIESMLNLPTKPKQQDIAIQLEVHNAVVTRAKQLLALLNRPARDLIFQNLKKPEGYRVSENPVFRLIDLGDPQKLQEALKIVIDKEMTEKEAKRLVAWVKDGKPMEDFDPKAPKLIPTPSPLRGEGRDEGAVKTNSVDSAGTAKTSLDKPQATFLALILGPVLWKGLKWLVSAEGPKPLKTALLLLLAGGLFRLGLPFAMRGFAHTPKPEVVVKQVPTPLPTAWPETSSRGPGLSSLASKTPMESGLYRSPIKPKEESGMAVPGRLQEAQAAGPETTSRGPLSTVPGRLQEAQAAGPETTRRGPLSAVQGRIQNAPAPTLVPDPNKTRLEEEAKFVKTFAEQVYGVSYLNMMDWIDYLKTALAQDYRDQFYKDFYPDEKINEINKKKLTLSFQPSKPAEFLNQYGDMDDFEVEGVVTTKSDLNNPGELVSTQPVTLNVGVLHGSDLKLPFSVGRLASSP